MRVLITGGAGYIGSVATRRLVSEGFGVIVLDRGFWGTSHIESLGVDVVRSDVRSFDLDLLDGVDAVLHLAGLSNDPTSDYNPTANWEMNVVGTARLANVCAERGLRLIFGSSCSLYDGLDSRIVWDEKAPVRPIGAYAESKAAAETEMLGMSGDGYCPVVLRQATVYGHSDRLRLDLVVNTFVKDALVNGRLSLHGGGRMWRPLVSLSNLCDAYVACLRAPTEIVRGETFNILEDNYQIRQLAMVVAGTVQMFRPGHQVALNEVAPPPRIRDYRCSATKMHQRLGLDLRNDLLRNVEELVHHLGGFTDAQLHDPRHYNIQWMTLLEQAASVLSGATDIWSSEVVVPARVDNVVELLPEKARTRGERVSAAGQ